jgi:hypothetical protein
MKTAMQLMLWYLENEGLEESGPHYKAIMLLEKEKEQIQKAFSDGQETPINHPTLPHYSRDEYYNDNYNQDN